MIPEHVLGWARSPGPARVLAEVRRRIEAGRCGPRAQIEIDLSVEERGQVGRMLDARWQVGGAPVPVARLRTALAGHGVELEDLLVVLAGPLRNLPEERRAWLASRADDRQAGARTLAELDPRVPARVVERVLVGAESRAERASQIAEVVAAISGTERLAVLAARLFGDAHALDRSTPLGRAVARFLSGAAVGAEESGGEQADWVDPVSDANAWRQAWATRQVICDEVSTQVLVLNLPLVGNAPAVRLAALPGEPVWLTLRSLRGSVALPEGISEVFVCENPSVVEAAADRFGSASKPLICTFGVPSLAAHQLLAALSAHATLHVRADGDLAGHRIVADLLARHPGSRRWQMASDCQRFEEELLDVLLDDLAQEPEL